MYTLEKGTFNTGLPNKNVSPVYPLRKPIPMLTNSCNNPNLRKAAHKKQQGGGGAGAVDDRNDVPAVSNPRALSQGREGAPQINKHVGSTGAWVLFIR